MGSQFLLFGCFFFQTVQVIVQARLGEKICTRSSSSPTGSDWVKFLFFAKGYTVAFVTTNHSAVIRNTINNITKS